MIFIHNSQVLIPAKGCYRKESQDHPFVVMAAPFPHDSCIKMIIELPIRFKNPATGGIHETHSQYRFQASVNVDSAPTQCQNIWMPMNAHPQRRPHLGEINEKGEGSKKDAASKNEKR